MAENELTVTRALAELTTIKKRVEKLTNNTTFIGTRTTGQAWKDFQPEARANWQAINDLLNRYNNIKFAIIRSNAITRVQVSGMDLTVAEVIVMKECMIQKKTLLQSLRHQRDKTTRGVEQHEREVQKQLDRLLEGLCKGHDGNKDQKQITDVSETYRKNNRCEVVDPINLDKEIEALDRFIDSFNGEVDFVLSESNALTKIDLKGHNIRLAKERTKAPKPE
uniref:Uncharacterized protein n=1 Tax=Marseillevirus LCMAC101 TaxID=2506602 RepID=A0A481YRT3_9VIRU|nr:MAG: hypothetical protein LCMAC101_04930 [Marseillevirus LCMAC101]